MLAKLWIFFLFCLTYGSCANLTKSFQEVSGTIIGNRAFSPADDPYLVISELVVAHNATLTIEAGSEVVFVPTVGLRVHGSLRARGRIQIEQRFVFRFYNPGIRLVNGTSHRNSRLEIQQNGQWGTICNYANRWDYRETAVACRQLGFLGAKRYYRYPASGPVYIKDVYCNGKEETLWDCGYSWSFCCELSLV
ncbi:protein bark beetle-like [Acropora millepora]|uniref:protein bark beetle-like n=1 Tax=Acropora millepora TaxID=45264 RepID=UPI001CF4751D|nr:protein bark beetle-like [Acropora millepora]